MGVGLRPVFLLGAVLRCFVFRVGITDDFTRFILASSPHRTRNPPGKQRTKYSASCSAGYGVNNMDAVRG